MIIKKIQQTIITGLMLICLITITSCNTNTPNKPIVVSTIGMIHNMVQEIAKDNVTAIGLMGPGIDPHLYKASAGDIKTLSSANLILYNGLNLEAKMIDLFEKMTPKKITKTVTSRIPKSELIQPQEFDGFYDPHVWFDVRLWQLASLDVLNALIELDEKNAEIYKKNHAEYKKKLLLLDQWVQNEVNKIPEKKRLLITAHDAFGYFGKRYNIQVVGLQGISTASEAGTKDIQHVTNIIINNKIPTIFVESSVPIRQIQALKAAVNAKGWNVEIGEELYTDAMGDPNTMAGTYIGMIQHNVRSIVNGLTK